MTTLTIFDQNQTSRPLKTLTDGDAIASALAEQGIQFERWPERSLPADADQAQLLAAYAEDLERLKRERGMQSMDVISLSADNPKKEELRGKFLDEHRHSEDEIRFFVHGKGLFYLHLGERVYAVLCEKNDLLSVPDGTPHWFDMGPEPEFTAIRLFSNPEGWVAQFTGNDIASQIPRYEALVEPTA